MKVIAKLIGDKQIDEQTAGNADGEASYIDKRKNLVLPKKSDKDFKAQHDPSLRDDERTAPKVSTYRFYFTLLNVILCSTLNLFLILIDTQLRNDHA
jgi:hypothetical protein